LRPAPRRTCERRQAEPTFPAPRSRPSWLRPPLAGFIYRHCIKAAPSLSSVRCSARLWRATCAFGAVSGSGATGGHGAACARRASGGLQRSVARNVLAGPDAPLRPGGGRCRPERVIGRQSEMNQPSQTRVEGAGGIVGFAEAGLVADCAKSEPALAVEGARS